MFLQGTFFFLLFIFTIYTVILGYHWYTYGRSKKTTTTLLATYLIGGIFCFVLMGTFLIT